MADETKEIETTEEVEPVKEIIEKLIPPVYSRQLKFLGIVIWSDTRHLDEDAIYERVAEKINYDLAKQVLSLQSTRR